MNIITTSDTKPETIKLKHAPQQLTIQLQHAEYMSDHASSVMTDDPIVILIQALTGAGKSYFMLDRCNRDQNGIGAAVLPVIMLMEQQKALAIKRGKDVQFVQIEKIDELTDEDILELKCLFIDECQILVEGGYRKSVEALRRLIERCRGLIPVYLLTAKIPSIEMLGVKIDKVFTFNKQYPNEFTAIGITGTDESRAQIKQFTNSIKRITKNIITKHQNQPAILFIESRKRGAAIVEYLNANGIKALAMSSERITECWNVKESENQHYCPEAHRVNKFVVANQTLVGCGYDVIVSTNVMAEGINLLDRTTIISTQTTPAKILQQFGRPRNDADLYLIHGLGANSLFIRDGKLVDVQEGNGRDIKNDDGAAVCEWEDVQAKACADLYSSYANHVQRAIYGDFVVQTMIDEFQIPCIDRLEYTYTEEEEDEDSTLSDVHKSKVVEAIKAHGLPKAKGMIDTPIHLALEATGVDKFMARDAVGKAIDAKAMLESTANWGSIKASWLTVYGMLPAEHQQQFCKLLDTPEVHEQTMLISDELYKHRDSNNSRVPVDIIESLSSDYMDMNAPYDQGDGIDYRGLPVDTLTDWQKRDGKRRTRHERHQLTMFMVLVGMAQTDSRHWYMPARTKTMDEVLTRSEQVKVAKHRTTVHTTYQDELNEIAKDEACTHFMGTHQLTLKQLTQFKPKEVKAMAKQSASSFNLDNIT